MVRGVRVSGHGGLCCKPGRLLRLGRQLFPGSSPRFSGPQTVKEGIKMSLIDVSGLSFHYEGSPDMVFENVSFQVDTDWKLGLIGRNGKGKTTLLKLLMGEYEYSGRISASVDFEYFPCPVENGELDMVDLLYTLQPDCQLWRVKKELHGLRMGEEVLEKPFDILSNGEQTKVLLALLFSRENGFLLIDEPTNQLDMEAREAVSRYLNTKKGFILVSHDRAFMDACVDHVLVLNRASVEVQRGNFSSWQENKRMRDNEEIQKNERLKKEIGRLAEAAGQAGRRADGAEATKLGRGAAVHATQSMGRAYIGEKSRKMQMQRKNLERRRERELEEKKGLLRDVETVEDIKLFPLEYRKEILVTARELSLSYGGDPVCDGLSFQVRSGSATALCGRNGCGKSSVLKAVLQSAGEEVSGPSPEIQGVLETGSGLIISWVPQSADYLAGTAAEFAAERGIEESLFKALLRKLDFSREQLEKDMRDYSAGQKKKVLLAGSLCTRAHLYIWDEPLNYIDIFSRMQLEELIRKYRPTILLVEHDRTFLERIEADLVEIYDSM